MKKIKFKMFGKNSISTLLFWIISLILVIILIFSIKLIPNLFQDKNSLIILNLMPLLTYLAFLIPLLLLFYEFKKEVLFTKRCIRCLYLFSISIFLALFFRSVADAYYLDAEYGDLFLFSIPSFFLIIFALFMASIFRYGYKIQQENDLTI